MPKVFCEGTLRSYVPFQENSPKTGRRRGCHTGCHHSGRFQKESEIEGNSLSQLSGTPRPVARKNPGQRQKGLEWTPEPMSQVVPRRYFTKNSPLIQKTNKKLFGPGKTKINVVGQFQATMIRAQKRIVVVVNWCFTPNTEAKQTLFVVGNLQQPLLGRPAIEALHLLERVNILQSQGGSDQNSVKNEFQSCSKDLENCCLTRNINKHR